MKDAMHRGQPVVAARRRASIKERIHASCSICANHIWFDPTYLTEPEGAPEPVKSWVLCKSCYQALLDEMRRSPVHSPLRLRIAMGIVAAERWPQAYPTTEHTSSNDQKWFVFMAVGFAVAMILHLVLIVLLAGIIR